MSGLMAGKRGLIMGLANDKSLAWGIARHLAAQGAERGASWQAVSRAMGGRSQGGAGWRLFLTKLSDLTVFGNALRPLESEANWLLA